MLANSLCKPKVERTITWFVVIICLLTLLNAHNSNTLGSDSEITILRVPNNSAKAGTFNKHLPYSVL